MARKKNLERAIVLGLLLSTSVCGSAWADFVIEDTPLADYYVAGMFDSTGSTVNDKTIYSYTDHNLDGTVTKNHDYRLAGYPIAYGVYTHAQGGDVEATINVNNFNINVRNFVPDVHDHIANEIEAAGIVTGAVRFGDNENNSSITNIISTGNISIDVITQNSKNAYGIYSKKNGTTDIKTDGIVINVKKTLDSEHKFGDSQNKIADSDYSKSSVYGINSEQGNTILNAANNIEISASIDIADNMKNYSDYQSNYDELLKGNIYAVSNTNGTIDLSTGNENETGGIISLSATANKGNAYGLYTKNGVKNSINNAAKFIITAKSTDGKAFGIYADNDKNNEYNNLTNYIHAESDSGEAYGIYAINGSQIDIIATGTDENGYGNTITSNKIGVAISSGTQLNITGETYIAGDDSAMLINAATTKADITGNLTSYSKNGNAAKLTNGALLDVSENANFISDGTPNNDGSSNALVIEGNGTFNGKNYQAVVGENLTAISKDNTAISLSNGASLHVGGNEIIYGENGLVIDSSQHNVTGDLIGRADNIAVNVMGEKSNLTVGGNILVEGGNIGVTVENNTITVNGGDCTGANVIKSNSGNALKTVGSTVTLNAGANGANSIVAGENFDKNNGYVYYTGIAINATGDDDNTDSRNGSTVDILGAENNIGGAVNAAGAQTTVNLAGSLDTGGTAVTGANNWISSAAVIKNAGDLESSNDEAMRDLDVVSALYAEDGATINLSGINNIQTYYKNPSDDTTSERVVWAYDKANINIDGYTYISTSKYANSPENKDIAIAAGTATNLNDDSFGDNYPAEADWANVNVTYNNYGEEQSSITGDILAAYAGNVDIKAAENSDAGINVLGDLLSGNGGKLSVDFGNGGTWTGRGDSYIDAGTQQDYESHQYFYSPAFSSDIITGGDIEVTMKNGTWNVTGQSWLNTFNATDTDIYMTDEDNVTNAVTINKMTGSGNTFHMNLDNDKRMDSDMLYIKESGEEGATFDVEVSGVINGLSDVTEENGLRFATVGNGVNLAQITLDGYGVIKGVDGGAFNTNLYVKREAYDVNNAHNDEFNGEGLTADKPGSSTVEDMFGLTEDEEKQPEIMTLAAEIPSENDSTVNSLADNLSIVKATQDGLSDAGKTMLNMSRANYSNAIYMDRLNKRLGEARYINAEDGEGMWVRIRHDRIGKTDAYRSQNTMYELGYDVKQECDNGERRVGMAVDYMHGDTGYSDIAGKGEIDRYGLWLYDTWMGNKGHYVDYVAKWGHLSNDFELYTMSRGEKVTGDYSNNVFSISAEYGRKKDLGGDWYIEPQAQLQLARVSGAEYNTSQHTEVSVDGINSLIGRAGFRLGKDFGEDKRSTVYIKADVLHEFLGDQDIYVRDETTNGHWAGISYENEGTWYDVGFGFATAVGKNSYAFMDFEKSFGHDNDETYQINVGMQWSF